MAHSEVAALHGNFVNEIGPKLLPAELFSEVS